MSRTYFPTRNENGVRDLSASVTLGGYVYDGYRGPAEPAAKAAMNPVNLGAIMAQPDPIIRLLPRPVQIAPPNLNAPSVSSQSTPTPQVTVPATPPPTVIYVSSGGGTASPAPAATSPATTQSPATSTIVTAAPGLTDQVASWLGGSTPLFGYNIPNALLAGGVAIAVAMAMSGGKRR